ncbi:MAG TPA: NAD(P)/FAD-dependent oxidoreductase [Spirochaetia bacterium]|nr:NAD(P)/FAD-dependent oxidoreductase [Spirochaetia bacterium]
MSDRYDVIVAGAGHNSLVAAAYLSKAGFRCLVLESRSSVGGDTNTEELTLPGFRHDACSTAHNLIQSSPLLRNDELHLGDYGLEYLHPDPVVHIPFPDGTWLTQWRDPQRTAEELGKFSKHDAGSYLKLLADYEQVAPLYGRHRYTPIGWGPPMAELLAGHPEGRKWMRRQAMSAWQIIENTFEDPHNRAFLLWMAFMTMQPADRPGTGALAYSLVFGRQRHSWTIPKGGSGALPTALVRLIEACGGTILTKRRVTRLIVEGGRCTGVETAEGERFHAGRAVLSSIHIKHLIDMAPPEAWDDSFRFGVETWRPGVSMFVTHYATTEPPRFSVGTATLESLASGTPGSVERMLEIGPQFSRREVDTEEPVLLVLCQTVADPSRAPAGKHTLKVVGFQPYELPEGPDRWDEIEAKVSEANLNQLRRFAPNLTDEVILSRVIESPLGLERFNEHNWHGSCHGGDQVLSQSSELRPAPGWAAHRMPIDGLYQTGSTTHPGGSVSGAPGRNAAMVMLKDLGSSLEEALANG